MSVPTAHILRMNDVETIRFIELYENEPVLWDQCHLGYKNKEEREAAAQRVASNVNIQDFTAMHVILKFKNLRSSYLQELKKIKEDDNYYPKVIWFTYMDRFLKPHVKSRNAGLNLQDSRKDPLQDDNYETEQHVDEQYDQTSTSCDRSIKIEYTPIESPSPEQFAYKVKKRSAQNTPSGSFISAKTRKTSINENNIEGVVNKLNAISRRVDVSNMEDQLDHFGKYVASMLRNVPSVKCLQLQQSIISLLITEQINLAGRAVTSSEFISEESNDEDA